MDATLTGKNGAITINLTNEDQEKASAKADQQTLNRKVANALKYGRPLATVKNLPESPTREQVVAAATLVRERTQGKNLSNDEVFELVPIEDLPHPRIHPYIGQWYRSTSSIEKLTDLFFEQHNKWLKDHIQCNGGPITKPRQTKPKTCPHCGKPI